MSIAIGMMIVIAGGVLIAFFIKALFTTKLGRAFLMLVVGLGLYFWMHEARVQLEANHPELTRSDR